MIWFIYNILFAVGYTVFLPYFLFRMARRGGYMKGFLQRVCYFRRREIENIAARPRLWIHAVSVGEVLIALRFIEEFRSREPAAAFVLTTTTSTGHAVAAKKIDARDVLAYFPIDFPFIMRRAIGLFRPRAVLLVESELWPNLIRLSAGAGIPVVLVNGRLSEGSERGYRVVGPFFRRAIKMMKLMCVQTPEDERRLTGLGALAEAIKITGSGKYDVAEANRSSVEKAGAVLKAMGVRPDDPVIVGGSTWPGEERILLESFGRLKAVFPKLRLILVPRHAERCRSVAAEIGKHGLTFVRRSAMGGPGQTSVQADVLLVDTTGELSGFYACATVVFVGKSLTTRGGQNIIEPAMFGKPVIVGPNMGNFAGVVRDFVDAKAIVQVLDGAGLETAISGLLSDPEQSRTIGTRGEELVKRKKGSVSATVDLVREAISNTGR